MKNFFQKFKDYGFWVSLAGAVVLLLNCFGKAFGFSVQNQVVEDCIMAIAGVLVVLGIVTGKPKFLQNGEDENSPENDQDLIEKENDQDLPEEENDKNLTEQGNEIEEQNQQDLTEEENKQKLTKQGNETEEENYKSFPKTESGQKLTEAVDRKTLSEKRQKFDQKR